MTKRDGPLFSAEKMPRYDGVGPTQQYETECCNILHCPQRTYNRICVLTLLRLAQAYAGLVLMRRASGDLWRCDEEGHTENCPREACTFGRDMVGAIDLVTTRFGWVVQELAAVLTIPSLDISPQWHDFQDIEQAAQALLAPGAHAIMLEMLRQEVVNYDPLEYARWFRPPVGSDERPT